MVGHLYHRLQLLAGIIIIVTAPPSTFSRTNHLHVLLLLAVLRVGPSVTWPYNNNKNNSFALSLLQIIIYTWQSLTHWTLHISLNARRVVDWRALGSEPRAKFSGKLNILERLISPPHSLLLLRRCLSLPLLLLKPPHDNRS